MGVFTLPRAGVPALEGIGVFRGGLRWKPQGRRPPVAIGVRGGGALLARDTVAHFD